jgi:hypothetical protein
MGRTSSGVSDNEAGQPRAMLDESILCDGLLSRPGVLHGNEKLLKMLSITNRFTHSYSISRYSLCTAMPRR